MAALPESRRGVARALAALVVLALLAPVAASAVTAEPTDLQPGTVEAPADGPTVVGVQGFKAAGQRNEKKPARVVSVRGDGAFAWQLDGHALAVPWFYDVDPLPDDDLLVVGVGRDGTVVFRIDRETREVVWREELPYHDTHDVDLLPGGNLLVGNMRQFEGGVSNDRVLVYDRDADEVVWEWVVRAHYPNDTAGGFSEDWTHLNDVDRVGDGLYMASIRNFDQVVVINRSTKEVEARLGSDEAHDVLYEQHNPDLVRGEDGTPSILVADSENDRVVEYRRRCDGGENGLLESDPDECEWERTWTLGDGQLNWPRDADRLPNGNTLVTDTLNHRVIEVTPGGRIVWEYYVTWGPYEAERIGTGDGSSGPTMRERGVAGSRRLSNSAGLTPGTGRDRTFSEWLASTAEGTPLGGPVGEFATRWSHVTPWIRPYWMTSWELVRTVLGGVVLAGWLGVEAVRHRRRLRAAAGDLAGRVRRTVQ